MPIRMDFRGRVTAKDSGHRIEPSDLFQSCHDPAPIRGSLDEVMVLVDDGSVRRAIKIGACSIFHGCVHNRLYEKISFRSLPPGNGFIAETFLYLKSDGTVGFLPMSETLSAWSKKWIRESN